MVAEELSAAFGRADFAEVIRRLDRHFGESTYSIKSLFRDEQRKVLNLLLESTLPEAETLFRQIYEHHTPLMQFLSDLSIPLSDLHIPLPKAFHMAASFILNIDLRRAFEEEVLHLDRLRALLEAVHKWQIELDTTSLGYTLQKSLERLSEQLASSPNDLSLLITLEAAIGLLRSLPFEVNLWKVQNLYYDLLRRIYPEVLDKADQEDPEAQVWVNHFVSLGEVLLIKVE